MPSALMDLVSLGRNLVLTTNAGVVLLGLNVGCGPAEKRPAEKTRPHGAKSGSRSDATWECSHHPDYSHEHTDAICAWANKNPGRPTTYPKCEELAGMLREMSRVHHNCGATNYKCIGYVASELGLEQMPNCSTLPGRPQEVDTSG